MDTSQGQFIVRIQPQNNKGRVFYLHCPDPSNNNTTSWPEVGSNLLSFGVPYRLSFYNDLSRGQNNFTYGFKIVNLTNGQVVGEITEARNRQPNTPADRFVIHVTAPSTTGNPNPFLQIDNIHVEARNKIRPTLFLMK